MIESVSRRAFGGSSGTYNVRATELARDRRLKTLTVTVIFLDDTKQLFQLEKRAKGHVLLELVFQHLELVEKHYFGLQFSDNGVPPTPANADIMRWLDPAKPVKKQMRGQGYFYLRVKFYVSDPSKLQEEYTRYHFYLQIRKDILNGKLIIPPSTACLLASYMVQSELGDYHPDDHGPKYISGMQLIPGQTEEMERKIAELHKLHKGQTPADAEFNFLDHAKRLDMYGVDLHRARDSANKELQLGVTSTGLVVFQNGVKINNFSWGKIVKISFKRKQFFIQLRREPSESYDTLLGFNVVTYRSCKVLWKSCVEHHTFFRLHSPAVRRRTPLPIGSRVYYSGRTELQAIEEARLRPRVERTFIRCSSRKLVVSAPDDKNRPVGVTNSTRSSRAYDNKVTSLSREPRRAWGENSPNNIDDDGGFLDRTIEESRAFTPVLPARAISYADEEPDSERPTTASGLYDLSHYSPQSSPHLTTQVDEGVVFIRMTPDEEGRFGFNVKGGSDLAMPILVSRVAPNTPADRCYPKLNEGDQVLCINGIDVGGMLHEQVVNLIRASRDAHGGELVLTVRPSSVYEAGTCPEEKEEEPLYQYVSDTSVGRDSLEQSIGLLREGLMSGSLVLAFDRSYRKKPGLTTTQAALPQNSNSNRYTDILPYDLTRVILESGANGDYINANYVNMEIPGSGIINRYIATQGPLVNTVGDFWTMVWEAGSSLVVMVTSLMERGRAKCHKYWPNIGETLEGAGLRLKSVRAQYNNPAGFISNTLTLTHLQSGVEREITQLQYIGWPDHGVPDNAAVFLQFIAEVRRFRVGMVEPTIVHCSAGIGRTGVLILMETALCLIEANQPVYPLQIVQHMRDQRAMMVQTSSQFRFVCTCILHAFTEGICKPLPEYLYP
ncbi:tyrosine-protein phosphatase non-receptor type 4 isoform X2 [Halyomorpha halys]|nr:tyrosine-protein phosphatase non-receptor type 4 [Halyomorpha halys]XP_014294111.1 tyrosine-protein phosphatase non-receptor type 4 [Halyomorpha halys]XP_014294112.1 tyrosine-protein phosphatase non-receptor type 4 [Halyomorpha halys]